MCSSDLGIIGREKFSYNIWGPAVTLAMALKASAPQASVLVSASVFNRLQDSYSFTSHEPVWVADTGERIDAWEITLQAMGSEDEASLSPAPSAG